MPIFSLFKDLKRILLNLKIAHGLSLLLFFNFQEDLAASPLKSMSYEEIITLAKPQWVVLSPTGRKAAFCVRNASLEENRNIETLYLFDRLENRQEKIYDSDQISKVIWGHKEDALYLLVKDNTAYKIIVHKDENQSVLIESNDPISLFALSPDESKLFFTQTKSTSDDLTKRRKEEGYVYNWGRDDAYIYKSEYRHKEWEEIWYLDFISGQFTQMTSLSYKNWVDHLSGLVTSLLPSDRYLLMSINQLGQPELGGRAFKTDIVVWDTVQKESFFPFKDSIKIEQSPCWIEKNQFILQQITLSSSLTSSIWLFNAESHQGSPLEWLTIPEEIYEFRWDNENKVLYGISSNHLYKIFWNEKKVETINLPKIFDSSIPSFDLQCRYFAFIDEASNEPPEIALYDIEKQKINRLTSLNPQLTDMARGFVEKIQIKTQSGLSTSGYLVHPVGEIPGNKYPIIIATYGFEGKFIADGEWHSSFPAQTLAGKGFVVLLLNHKGGGAQQLLGDSQKARQIEGWNQLELFEQAIETLVEKGIGDSSKVGLYGWSHGGFLVSFLISHSQKFHVACLGEGADYNPGGFWLLGVETWQKIYDNMFGGPPWGDTLKNYLDFSPFFNIDKIRTPLLLEFVDLYGPGMEIYAPLRYLGIPAELVIYEGEEHSFVKPKARLASMKRKLEWFNFWLLNKEDAHPDNREQYARWKEMRQTAIKRGLKIHGTVPFP